MGYEDVKNLGSCLIVGIFLIILTLSQALAQENQEIAAKEEVDGAAEMARQLQDPLANIAAIMTDNDIFFNKDVGTSYSFQIQPVYSFDFPKQGFSFIPRGVIPILGVPPVADLPRLGLPRPKGDGTTWGLGDIVTGNFFLLGPEYDRTIDPYEFDLEESKRLLEEAGWSDLDGDGVLEKMGENGEEHTFEFNFLIYGNSEEWRTTATVYK